MKTVRINKNALWPRRMFCIVFIFGLLALNVACTSMHAVRDPYLKPIGFPQIEVSEDIIDTSMAEPVGSYRDYKIDIAKVINDHFQKVSNEQIDVSFNISKIELETKGSSFTAAQFFMTLFSTPVIIPLSFIMNPHNVSYSVYYTVADISENIIYHKKLNGTIRGGFSGWSVLRLAFRSSLLEKQGRAVANDAARQIINDIIQNYPRILKAAAPPSMDLQEKDISSN